MVYRHSRITRITHGLFFCAFVLLALTGTQILLHAHWLRFKVTGLHEYAGLVMIACGLFYLGWGLLTGRLRDLIYRPQDGAGIWPMAAYYLRLRKEPPEYSGYNPLQKLAYTVVLLVIAPVISVTGVMLWARIGGRAAGHVVIAMHLGVALELVAFFFGHMMMVAATGMFNNVRSIVTGWWQAPAPPICGGGAVSAASRAGRASESSTGSIVVLVRGSAVAGTVVATETVD